MGFAVVLTQTRPHLLLQWEREEGPRLLKDSILQLLGDTVVRYLEESLRETRAADLVD